MNSPVLDPLAQYREPLAGVSLTAICQDYSITVRSAENATDAAYPKTLSLDNGTVTLDGAEIPRPKLGDYTLSWGRRRSHARLQMSKDRLWFEGIIGRSGPGDTAALYVVTGVAKARSTTLSDGRLLMAGYQVRADGSGQVDLHCTLGGTDLGSGVETQLDEAGGLHVSHPSLPSPVTLPGNPVPSVSAARPATVTAQLNSGEGGLTLQNLTTMDTEGIGDQTQELMIGNLSWALEPKWSTAFFSSVPNLSQDPTRMNVIDQDCEWYNCSFSPAYFGFGLSQMTRSDPQYTLSAQYVSRLQYYLCEDIGEDPAYMRQTKALTVLAALQATAQNNPNLADYVNDPQNPPPAWAQQLYNDYLNTPAHYTLLTGGLPDGGGTPQTLQNIMQTINNYATILTVLDPTGQTAQQYYQSAYAAVFAAIMPNAQLPSDVGAYEEWLGDWIQAFLDAYTASPTAPADPAAAAAWSVGQDFQAVINMGLTVDEVATSFAQLFVASSTGLLSTTAQQTFNNLTGDYPKLMGVGKYTFVILLSALWVQSLIGIGNMDTLTGTDLATAIANLVGLTAGMIAAIPDILVAAQWVGTNAAALAQAFRVFFLTPGGIRSVIGLQGAAGNAMRVFQWMRTVVVPGGFNLQGTAFARVFQSAAAAKCLAVLGGAVAVVAFGISLYQFIADFQSGASVTSKVLDGLNALLNFAVAAAAFATIFTVSVIPAFIGAVAALGGLILWFVASFLQDDPPPAPPDQYLENVAAPFAAALPDPPQGWTPPSMTGSTTTTAVARRQATRAAVFGTPLSLMTANA